MQMLRMLRIALALPLLLVLKAFPLIVYQGKIVDAWPDAPASTALPKGAAGAAAHYYPHPAGEV